MSYVRNAIRSPRAVSPVDQRLVLEVTGQHVDGFRDHLILSLALGTALRESEIVALNVGDVIRTEAATGQKATPTIRTKVRLRVFKRSKSPTQESRQVVFLPRMVRIKLAKFLSWKKRKRQDLRPGAPLFVSRHRRRISTRRLRAMFRSWQRRAGLEELYNFHALRHAALTNLYAATKDLLLVQKHARHASSSTTEIYAHVSEEDVRRAVEELPS